MVIWLSLAEGKYMRYAVVRAEICNLSQESSARWIGFINQTLEHCICVWLHSRRKYDRYRVYVKTCSTHQFGYSCSWQFVWLFQNIHRDCTKRVIEILSLIVKNNLIVIQLYKKVDSFLTFSMLFTKIFPLGKRNKKYSWNGMYKNLLNYAPNNLHNLNLGSIVTWQEFSS